MVPSPSPSPLGGVSMVPSPSPSPSPLGGVSMVPSPSPSPLGGVSMVPSPSPSPSPLGGVSMVHYSKNCLHQHRCVMHLSMSSPTSEVQATLGHYWGIIALFTS